MNLEVVPDPAGGRALRVVTGCGKKSDTIKIGQAVALTGDNSTWGQSEKNALDMEIAKINDQGRRPGQADPADLL